MNENMDIPPAVKTPEPPTETVLDLKASREAKGF